MSRRDPVQHFRLPSDIVAWIDQEAKENERSKNAQIVYVFKQAMKKATGPALESSPVASE